MWNTTGPSVIGESLVGVSFPCQAKYAFAERLAINASAMDVFAIFIELVFLLWLAVNIEQCIDL
jgi:hypothetical protein